MIEVKVPSVGESVSEVQVGQWLKSEGEWVERDENIVDLETEKASVQVPAPQAGYIRNIRKQVEEFATVDDVLCDLEPADAPSEDDGQQASDGQGGDTSAADARAPKGESKDDSRQGSESSRIMPAAQRLMEESGLRPEDVTPSGPGGRILKEDVLAARQSGSGEQKSQSHSTDQADSQPAGSSTQAPAQQSPSSSPRQQPAGRSGESAQSEAVLESSPEPTGLSTGGEYGGVNRMEEVKPLSMIRRTIAARLVQAQQTAALLSTFNEVNMQPIMDLRTKYRDQFQERHGVKLGFMSFFAKASVEALRRYPSVNAELRGNNIVYRHFHDIGIAIGGGKGLVVPILRNVEHMSFADVERSIGDFASKAMDNRLMPHDLEGGTFTISNGGVYGSMLSTPIVNPPQSAILGLHAIQERPMAENGEVVIRPMMYIALTYDHRIIDGREAVSFLKTIKEICEDPTRLFLEV